MSKRRGFTLIELLVVIALIALLATLVVLSIGRSKLHANNTAAVQAINSGGKAIEIFRNEDVSADRVISNDPNNHGQSDLLQGTTGTLGSIFTGKLATDCTVLCSYSALIDHTPSNKYIYSYTATDRPANASTRELVGPLNPFPTLYQFCTTIVLDNGANQWSCVDQEGNMTLLDYDPTGPGARVVPHSETIPDKEYDGMAVYTPSGKIYILGGHDGTLTNTPPTSTVYIYDPTHYSFTLTAPLDSNLSDGTATYVPTKNLIYLFGGRTPSDTNAIRAYNPAATNPNASTTVVGHIAQARAFATSVYDSHNNKVYIVGGSSNNRYIEEFDPNNPATTKTIQIPPQFLGREHAAIVYDNQEDRIMIFGGYNSAGPLNDILQFTPAANFTDTVVTAATQDNNTPLTLRTKMSDLSAGWDPINHRAFLLGGYGGNTTGAPSSVIQVYDGNTNQMLNRTETLPSGFTGNTVVWDQLTDSAFTLGGYHFSRITSANMGASGSVVEYITTPLSDGSF